LTFSAATAVTLAGSTSALNFASGLLNLDTTNSRVGIGTTAPNAKLEVLSTGTQTRLSYSGSVYANLYVDSAGNLQISTYPTGKDIQINDNNLRVCAGGSCPTPSYSGTGNLQVEGRVQIDAPAGTAPLIVQSSTTVTNLNADLLDGYHASQFRRPITIYLTASTFAGNHDCDDNPGTCCAAGYTMCRAWQLIIFDPRIDTIETTGTGRNTNPNNLPGWVEGGGSTYYSCNDWTSNSSGSYGTTFNLYTDGENNWAGFGNTYTAGLGGWLRTCDQLQYVWCCKNL
jgi:hypothetical protein